MGCLNDIEWGKNNSIEALTFDMGTDTFAIEACLVHEILDPLPETQVPRSDPLVSSVVNFRGRIIPLSNLRIAFDISPRADKPYDHVIVIECPFADQVNLIGIKADNVYEVATFPRTLAEDPPQIGTQWNPEYVRGLIKAVDRYIVIPDFRKILVTLHSGRQPCASP